MKGNNMDLEKLLTAVGKVDLVGFAYEKLNGQDQLVDSFLAVDHPTRSQLAVLLAAALSQDKQLMAASMLIGPSAAAALLDTLIFGIVVGAGLQDKLSKAVVE